MELLRFRPKSWHQAFLSEKNTLYFYLPQFKMNVEHIGATSVPNCRTFRNVDILISVPQLEDISTVAMLLATKGYKVVDDSNYECIVLVKKATVYGERITVRVTEYASLIYRRHILFKTYLENSYDNVQKYNIFRDHLFREVRGDMKRYNEAKIEYINNHIDEMFKFVD